MNPDDRIDEQLAFYRADPDSYESWHAEVFERGGGGAFGAICRRDRSRALEARLADLGWRAAFDEGEHCLWGIAVRQNDIS